MKNLWVLNQAPSRTLEVPGVRRKIYKGSEYKDYSTSRTSNGVHKVQMKSTKVHPSNDAKYESQKEKKN